MVVLLLVWGFLNIVLLFLLEARGYLFLYLNQRTVYVFHPSASTYLHWFMYAIKVVNLYCRYYANSFKTNLSLMHLLLKYENMTIVKINLKYDL